LAELKVMLQTHGWGPGEVRTEVVPAFEAVGGTLTHLHVNKIFRGGCMNEEVDVGYEWGVAVGKLRRLKDLTLDLFGDGRAYHAMAQGMAASVGGCPLPPLWRVLILSSSYDNSDLLASLLLPSVRVFGADCFSTQTPRGALLIACAVRRAGYKFTLMLDRGSRKPAGAVRAIASCMVVYAIFNQQGTSLWRSRVSHFLR
jgi:hypothetical protein